MKTSYDFRIAEDKAELYFSSGVGTKGPVFRRIVVSDGDPLIDTIRAAEEEFAKRGSVFLTYSEERHAYTEAELDSAELLRLKIDTVREPAGEECGTQYDESVTCIYCGSGRRQISELHLNLARAPKDAAMWRTIADEYVVASELRQRFEGGSLTGAEFGEVRDSRGHVSGKWSQIRASGDPVIVSEITRIGTTVFDDGSDSRFVCPLGHRRGVRLNSELSLVRSSWRGQDCVATDLYFGLAGGLLRPHREWLVSQRVRAAIRDIGARGVEFEVARLI